MDCGGWQAIVPRVTKSWTQLKGLSTHSRTGSLLLHGVSLVAMSRGYSLVAVKGLLTEVISLVVEHGF